MARETKGRMINRDISDSDKFSKLSPCAAVLFCMIIPHLDGYGKLNGGAGFLKDEVCPKVEYLTYENISFLMMEITTHTSMKWFIDNGRYWIHSTKHLSDHQKLDTTKLGLDKLPNYSGVTPELVVHEVEVEVEGKEEVKVEVKVGSVPKGTLSGKPDDAPQKTDSIPYSAIIEHFNDTCGTKYRDIETNRALIRPLWKLGFREPDFQKVIETMYAKWGRDPTMKQYLRPVTIFQPKKFEGYLNAEVTLTDRGMVDSKMEKSLEVIKRWTPPTGGGLF